MKSEVQENTIVIFASDNAPSEARFYKTIWS